MALGMDIKNKIPMEKEGRMVKIQAQGLPIDNKSKVEIISFIIDMFINDKVTGVIISENTLQIGFREEEKINPNDHRGYRF